MVLKVSAALGEMGLGFEPTCSLKEIREVNESIRGIRWRLKGDRELGLALFREAVKEKDAVLQIQLAYALYGMAWGSDKEKIPKLKGAQDLQDFCYYSQKFALFNVAYEEAMKFDVAMRIQSDAKVQEARGLEVFRLASDQGYLPAKIELKNGGYLPDTPGFAKELESSVGTGDKMIDYLFGRALKRESDVGSPTFYKGIYWMEHSIGITVGYPKEKESFDAFIERYKKEHSNTTGDEWYGWDGLYYAGPDVVLAPSKEVWKEFLSQLTAQISRERLAWRHSRL